MKIALNKINFEIKEGRDFWIFRSSGSGKTTMINTLTGQLLLRWWEFSIIGKTQLNLSEAAHEKRN